MKNFNKKLAVMILKNTTAYKLGHILYTVDSNSMVIWSPNTLDGNFNAPEITRLFGHPFSMYIDYNEEAKRCELNIF